MPVLAVIGGRGFVGRRVSTRFARKGWRVRVGTRRPDLAVDVRVWGEVGQVEPIAADVRRPESVRRLVRGADAVVNLAGILQESGGQRFSAVQAEGAGHVAAVARECAVARLAHVSAIGADPGSASRYARSKAEGELRVTEAFPGAVVLRPSIVFGEGDRFFTRFARMACLSPALPLVGADTRFQPTHVEDVGEAALRAILNDRAGGTYELGGPQVFTFRELMEIMLRTICRRRPILPIPFSVARPLSAVASLLPGAPITPDQVELLGRDCIVSDGARGFADLGIHPSAVEGVIGSYLEPFRPGGQYWKLAGQRRATGRPAN